MTRKEVEDLAYQLLVKWGLFEKGWHFEFSKSYRNLGTCYHNKKLIVFSEKWLKLPYQEILDTILHEIAHALCGPGEGHGAKWKRMCIKVGARPEASHKTGLDQFNPKKYKMVCPGCGIAYYRARRPGWYSATCRCNTVLMGTDWEINPNYVE